MKIKIELQTEVKKIVNLNLKRKINQKHFEAPIELKKETPSKKILLAQTQKIKKDLTGRHSERLDPVLQKEEGKKFSFASKPLKHQKEQTKSKNRFSFDRLGLRIGRSSQLAPSSNSILPEMFHATIWILSTQNNTLVTLTDSSGHTKAVASGGSCGFKGSRRSTAYAATAAARQIAKKALILRYRRIQVRLKGLSAGKRSALKGLKFKHLKILKIVDQTPIAHNGCRARKKRRI